jgi:hypothetical protein
VKGDSELAKLAVVLDECYAQSIIGRRETAGLAVGGLRSARKFDCSHLKPPRNRLENFGEVLTNAEDRL